MEEALFKGLVAAGYTMKREGGVLISVRDTDKSDLRELVKEYVAMGFHIYATSGTASRLNSVGISSTLVKKPKEAKEGEETTISLLEEGKISYVISTSKTGRQPGRDSVRLRRKAVELGIPCLTSLDTAAVLALTLESQYNEDNVELVDIAHIAHGAAARKELSQMENRKKSRFRVMCFRSMRTTKKNDGLHGFCVLRVAESVQAEIFAKAKFDRIIYDGKSGLIF